jgi:hypothetical protein
MRGLKGAMSASEAKRHGEMWACTISHIYQTNCWRICIIDPPTLACLRDIVHSIPLNHKTHPISRQSSNFPSNAGVLAAET